MMRIIIIIIQLKGFKFKKDSKYCFPILENYILQPFLHELKKIPSSQCFLSNTSTFKNIHITMNFHTPHLPLFSVLPSVFVIRLDKPFYLAYSRWVFCFLTWCSQMLLCGLSTTGLKSASFFIMRFEFWDARCLMLPITANLSYLPELWFLCIRCACYCSHLLSGQSVWANRGHGPCSSMTVVTISMSCFSSTRSIKCPVLSKG